VALAQSIGLMGDSIGIALSQTPSPGFFEGLKREPDLKTSDQCQV
jgi:hypothetical protein